MVEMFKLVNRVNLGTPNIVAYCSGQLHPTVGQITNTRTPATRTPARQSAWAAVVRV